MTKCDFCGTMIVFGGARDSEGRYCNDSCREKAYAHRRYGPTQSAMSSTPDGTQGDNIGQQSAQPVHRIVGVAGEMEVFGDKLTITPKGVLGFLNKGLKGTKTIPFSSIAAIQYKQPGYTNGYLQFSIPGGNESKGGVFAAASDENTFMFAASVNGAVIAAKDFIEQRIADGKRPAQAPSASTADEIGKLAALKAQGLLSDEEFGQAKKKLLGL